MRHRRGNRAKKIGWFWLVARERIAELVGGVGIARPKTESTGEWSALFPVRFPLRFEVDQFLGLAAKEFEFHEIRRRHIGRLHSR